MDYQLRAFDETWTVLHDDSGATIISSTMKYKIALFNNEDFPKNTQLPHGIARLILCGYWTGRYHQKKGD
jgi:hypothetical protein